MNIAVTYENGQVFQHFGHTQQFKVYQVEDGRVLSSRIEETGESGHGALAGFLKEHGVDTLLCGGIGGVPRRRGTGRYPPVRRRRRQRGPGGGGFLGRKAPVQSGRTLQPSWGPSRRRLRKPPRLRFGRGRPFLSPLKTKPH